MEFLLKLHLQFFCNGHPPQSALSKPNYCIRPVTFISEARRPAKPVFFELISGCTCSRSALVLSESAFRWAKTCSRLHCEIRRFKTANIKILSANSTHRSYWSHLFHSAACHKCKTYLLRLEFVNKILIFAVLKRRLLQWRETEISFCFYNLHVTWWFVSVTLRVRLLLALGYHSKA